MKVLYISATNTAEAGNRVMLTWINYFLEKGWEIGACCPLNGTLSYALQETLNTNYFPLNTTISNNLNFFLNLIKLFKIVLKFKPDIIHCNSESSYYLSRYVCRVLSVPAVVHIRFHFNKDFYAWLFKKKYRPSLLFFVSNSLLQEEKKKLLDTIDEKKLAALHNCLDSSLFDSYTDDISYKKNYINFGCYGSIQKIKAQEHLINLAILFKNKKVNYPIYVVGRAKEPNYYNYCVELCKKKQVDNLLRFVGHSDDVFKLMLSNTATISVSRYETFGMSVLESMALGVPVIAFDVPAIKEVVGNAGVIIKQNDIQSLAEACCMLAKDNILRSRLSDMARERFLKHFTSEKILPKLESHYKELVKGYENIIS